MIHSENEFTNSCSMLFETLFRNVNDGELFSVSRFTANSIKYTIKITIWTLNNVNSKPVRSWFQRNMPVVHVRAFHTHEH